MTHAPFPQRPWRTTEDLADWLLERFPEACIKPGEDLVAAHRRSAEVALAHRIANTIKQTHGDADVHE